MTVEVHVSTTWRIIFILPVLGPLSKKTILKSGDTYLP